MLVDYEFLIYKKDEVTKEYKFNSDFASAKEMAIKFNSELYQWSDYFEDYVKVFDNNNPDFNPSVWLFESFDINGDMYIVENLL